MTDERWRERISSHQQYIDEKDLFTVDLEYQFGQNTNLMKKEDTNKNRSKVGTKEIKIKKARFLEGWKTKSMQRYLFITLARNCNFCFGLPSHQKTFSDQRDSIFRSIEISLGIDGGVEYLRAQLCVGFCARKVIQGDLSLCM
jgi:hypothetical protein